MVAIIRITAYAAMAVVGLLGLKKEGGLDADSKKLLDLFK